MASSWLLPDCANLAAGICQNPASGRADRQSLIKNWGGIRRLLVRVITQPRLIRIECLKVLSPSTFQTLSNLVCVDLIRHLTGQRGLQLAVQSLMKCTYHVYHACLDRIMLFQACNGPKTQQRCVSLCELSCTMPRSMCLTLGVG